MAVHGGAIKKTPAYIEAIVWQTRETFGDTLPANFLSPEELIIYERLYGSPVQTTRPEDVRLLQELSEGFVEDMQDQGNPRNALFREDIEGNLEEVEYRIEGPQTEQSLEVDQDSVEHALEGDAEYDEKGVPGTNEEKPLISDEENDFMARMALYKDMVAANQAFESHGEATEVVEATEEDEYLEEAQEDLEEDENNDQELEDSENIYGEYENEPTERSHPITIAGKFGTTPSTIQIPRGTVLDPIAALLADASNKQLKEVAQKIFGGPRLPNSIATPSSKHTHLQQQPIALQASQFRMGEMEANAFVAANIPGAYAAVMSTLDEVRKRVGAGWLKNLLMKEGGPRILDAGGGAGALAWHEILRAEWKLLHPNSTSEEKPVPVGKSTIITGSSALRHRISHLLENTTFLPRLPDYNPSLDHPSLEPPNASPRKRYDIIVAPHTLWSLREDHMRKNQVQNFWSLLDPNGGILILIEKGVPRGFELIAGAREVLLKYHIASPQSPTAENNIQEPFEGRSREKETGMIIAPCTNHFKCPLYLTPGPSKGRKDYCHFSQRFKRPAFLQRLLNNPGQGHEDIDFSYVAVQRGLDQRQDLGIPQGQAASDAAFVGYEYEYEAQQDAPPSAKKDNPPPSDEEEEEEEEAPQPPFIHTLSLPRAILPPLKRQGHVILDLCTPAGKLERWTVPRSFSKQAYHDARKSGWGDLWALGAKTKVSRNLRLGEKSTKVRGKSSHEISRGRGDSGDAGFAVKAGRKTFYEKRTKKGRTAKPRLEMDEKEENNNII